MFHVYNRQYLHLTQSCPWRPIDYPTITLNFYRSTCSKQTAG